ncbi:MAG: translation initiation factor IF-2 subunit beta [Candidatus Micrarchaeia archaeon]
MDYEKALERAYASLPERVLKSERFEIPLVDSFIQGNKTIIRNFSFIFQTLRRKPEELAKYLFKELATPGEIAGNTLILHSKFNEKALNEKIKAFTEAAVLCKECRKPDTKLVEMERGVRMLVCEACGARSPVRL